MAMNRETTRSIPVVRRTGKIALEEAMGSPLFAAHQNYPPRPVIKDLDGLPFSTEFLADVESRLDDVELRLNLTSPGIEGVSGTETAIYFARETNNAIYNKYVRTYPDRFGFFACVAMHDPEEAAKELERAVSQLGAKGALINGFTNLDDRDEKKLRYLDAPECEPFLKMLHQLQVPLYIHPRLLPVHQQVLYSQYPNLVSASYGFGAECAGHALRIMCSGILDKYPVTIILGLCAEALPFIIHRADQRMKIGTPGTNGAHNHSLMHYSQNHFHATLAGVRRYSTMKNTIEGLGESRSNEDAVDWFDGLEVNESTRMAIAAGNATRLFGLPTMAD
ncbi:amidohydrolase family protein [Aspergillus saccharolyticus JOP 1030-1]|uniref:Amidohydrolase 2 n=1 Tax=Aspergillus saccharolyticus JOP 1030-1 TaxID=1450539 RepID=A0A319AHJ8_9EURO|nr:amidohydrolase 2 [Aspergillus saccharolyticus JOP 1030-1]PYH46072.1 amidohydrolase 2 [Aspergillus saccharolyticus JOP 1030-1]